MIRDVASGQHSCNIVLGFCPIGHAHRGLRGVWAGSRGGSDPLGWAKPPLLLLKVRRGMHG